MNKNTPFEKLSKKQRNDLNKRRRNTWGEVNPITRKPDNPKAYNRAKTRKWDRNPNTVSFFHLKMNEGDLYL